jgi:threonine/homoserine/homoserine lactone efflux protein
MGNAIGQVLPLAVGVALSPVPIIAVVLMLGTPRARVNGPAFVVGWVLGLTVVGGAVMALAGAAGASDDGPAEWVDWLKIALGALLLLVAVKQWRGRPRAGQAAPRPGWMKAIDDLAPTRALGIGAALSSVNPKNLLLTVGAAAAIAQAATSTGDEIVALAVFIAVGTLGAGIPVALYFVLGDRAARMLGELEAWMSANSAAIMSVLCLVIAAKLVGDGISGLG